MSSDVAQVAEQVPLLLLAAPASSEITGAYLVQPNGHRPPDESEAQVRSSDLAVLEWPAGVAVGASQPLELVLGRVRHLYQPGSVAIVAPADSAYPGRAVLAAAAEARQGLLWGSDRTAQEVVEQVRGLTDGQRTDPGDAGRGPHGGGVDPLAALLRGDASLQPFTVRLARQWEAALVVRDTDRQIVVQVNVDGADEAGEFAGEVYSIELEHAGAAVGSLTVHRAVDLDPDERAVADAISGILGLAMLAHTADLERAAPAQAQLALILGDDLQARETAFRRSRRLRLFVPHRMVIVVVEPFAEPLSRTGLVRLAEQLAYPLRAIDTRSTMIVHEGGLVILTSGGTDLDALARGFRRVASMPLSMGVGREVDDVRSLPGSHREAARAATIGRRLGAANQVTTYAQLGVRRLLYQLPEHERRAYVDEVLGPIAGHDAEAAENRRILHALRATHGSLAETARLLFVHRNTVRQRVARLEAVIGPFLDDADRRLAVFVALELHRLDDETS